MIFRLRTGEVSIPDGRSVAIVGNAQSLLDQSFGQQIDSFDIVIRLNRGFILKPQSQGTRTDLLGLSCKLTKNEFQRHFNCEKVLWLSPNRKSIQRYLKRRDQFSYYPKERWQLLYQELKCHRPSSGMMMVDYIVRHLGLSKVKVFGFDHKQTKTFYSETDHPGPHAWHREQTLLQSILLQCNTQHAQKPSP